MKEQEIEKDMKVLIERIRKDDKDINACIEYGKLYDSVTYLECLGYIELPSHHTDDFGLFRDYRAVARIRAGK
jgi:hypothetical protein